MRTVLLTVDDQATARTNVEPLSGTTTNTIINLKDYFDGCGIQCISTTSLAVKVYVSCDQGTTFEPVVSVDAAGTMTAADTTITPSAGDTISWNCAGATHVRITVVGAVSGTIRFKAWTGSPPVTTVVGVGTISTNLAPGAAVHANVSIPSANDTEILAASTSRKSVLVQNNAAFTVAIRVDGGALTGTTPTTAEPKIVLAPGASYSASGPSCPTGAIMAYQASGAATELVSVVST